jgi:hypothetical protein
MLAPVPQCQAELFVARPVTRRQRRDPSLLNSKDSLSVAQTEGA